MDMTLEQLNVTATSPDKSVQARMSNAAGLQFKLEPGTADRHTERSLGAQLTAAVNGAITGYRKGRAKAFGTLRAHWGIPDRPEADPASQDEPQTVTTSRAGNVSVRMRAQTLTEVGLRPGTLRRISETELLDELRDALLSAMTRHAELSTAKPRTAPAAASRKPERTASWSTTSK